MALPATDAISTSGAGTHLPKSGLIAVAWSGVGLAVVFLALRIFARLREARYLFADDYWMVAACVFLAINAVLQTLQTESLYHLFWVSAGIIPADEELETQGNAYVHYEFVIIGLTWTVLWCVKASFLALFYRLFDGLPKHRRIWWAVVVFMLLAYVGCWIGSIWTCHPPSTYFEFGQCNKPVDQIGTYISISYSTAVDILSDLIIMSFLLRFLSHLQVSRRQKAALAGVFCLGLIIIAVAVVRLTQIIGRARADPVGLAVWGLVESTVSVIIGCMPPLKSFLGKAARKYKSRKYTYGCSCEGKMTPLGSWAGYESSKWSQSIALEETNSPDLKQGQIMVSMEFGWVSEERSTKGSVSYPPGTLDIFGDEGGFVLGKEIGRAASEPSLGRAKVAAYRERLKSWLP